MVQVTGVVVKTVGVEFFCYHGLGTGPAADLAVPPDRVPLGI